MAAKGQLPNNEQTNIHTYKQTITRHPSSYTAGHLQARHKAQADAMGQVGIEPRAGAGMPAWGVAGHCSPGWR